EQLQLERQRKRVAARWPLRDLALVEGIEEARERRERPLVRLLLGEEPEHRLEADEADAEASTVLPGRVVRADEIHAPDRVQLTPALMQHELHVAERLEPRSEAGLRPPDALRDRAHPSALERVEVQHAVGLPQTQ